MSKFYKALEEAEQHQRPDEGAPARWRDTVPQGGDALPVATAKVARWIEEGRRNLVQPRASLLAEHNGPRVQAQDAEQESQRLPEPASSRFRLPNLSIRSMAVWLAAAGLGIAAGSGVAALHRGPHWPWSERAA